MRKGIVAGLFAGVLAAALAVPAGAEPAGAEPPGAESAGPSYPSDQDVENARDAEARAGDAVADAEARLAAVNDELDTLLIRAAHAVEAYNGARVFLEDAEHTEAAARAHAAEAADAAAAARLELGRLASASYRHGGGLATVGMILEARDGRALYDGASVLRSVTEGQAGVRERAERATRIAEQAAREAEAALAERAAAAEDARAAFQTAERAVGAQEASVAAVEAQRDAVVAALATARGTTVELEEARQAGLAAEAAAERQRRATREPPSVTEPTGDPTIPPPEVVAPSPTPNPPTVPSPSPPPPSPSPTPSEPPDPPPPPPPPSGAEAAIDFARAQVGKPYEWGADGPDTFDCSGLTMRAWQAGGVDLPHWSVAQARAVDRVSYAELAPGDLVFWSDNGEASGVYHVGLYIGGGQMIHAPRPGKNVEVQSVFYWVDPAFYGRV